MKVLVNASDVEVTGRLSRQVNRSILQAGGFGNYCISKPDVGMEMPSRKPLLLAWTAYNRHVETALEFLYSLQGWPAYGLVLGLLILCGVGAPMNEDIVLLAAAALTLKGVMDPVPLMLVGWVGIMIGDGLVFHWGHRFGAPLLRSRFFSRIVSPARLLEMQERVRRGGPYFIFTIRFLPGIRTALFFAAGSLKMPYRTLFIYDGAAALIELPILVYAVRYVGGNWQQIWQTVAGAQVDLLLGVGALLLFWLARRWYLNRKRNRQGDDK